MAAVPTATVLPKKEKKMKNHVRKFFLKKQQQEPELQIVFVITIYWCDQSKSGKH